MALVKFYAGTLAAYNGLATKDANAIYFITDSSPVVMYKGDTLYTKNWLAVDSLPSSGQIQGVLYVNAADNALYSWNGTEWKALSKPLAGVVAEGNVNPVTSGAVYTAIQNAVKDLTGGSVLVKNVSASDTAGKIKVDTGSGSTEFAVKGVIVNPTYDSETRTITLPYADDTASLVIDLGKDLVVKSGSYNAEKQEIELTLTSGDVIKIPVAKLIDIYTGAATNSIEVAVSGDNVITANVKVATAAEGEHNDLVIREDGLFVDVQTPVATAKQQAIEAAAADATTKADAALAAAKQHADNKFGSLDSDKTIAELITENKTAAANAQAAADKAQDAAEAADAKAVAAQGTADQALALAQENKGKIDVLNGNAETDGSVAKAVATGKQEAIDAAAADATTKANKAQAAAIEAAAGDATTKANAAQAAAEATAKAYTDSVLTWGTIGA